MLRVPGESFTLNIPYFCQRCGLCCSETSFPSSEEEKNSILRNINKSSKISEIELKKTPCTFLENKQCQIYSQRPILCREWFPRIESKCQAFQLHKKKGILILEDNQYQIGNREIIFIGKSNSDPNYPVIRTIDLIDKELLGEYNFPPKEAALKILEILDHFNLTVLEFEIFKAINPIYKFIDQSASLF
ncbi:MAG: YkgJ family cysteine cluster protein [Candidatus Hodarchaeales archaeon]